MPQRKYLPKLFDLPQDIIEKLPVDMAGNWVNSDQSPTVAQQLLAPNLVKGTTVSSDSAGLTRLSAEKSLIEVLALIDVPKVIVHRHGTSLGGQDLGIWAADNTQMWYPETVSLQRIVETLLTMQDEIKQTSRVQIGLGVHSGSFYQIGGGLYGPEADWIETLAENETEGGELVISHTIKEGLDEPAFSLRERPELAFEHRRAFTVLDGPRRQAEMTSRHIYPIPYSLRFYKDLLRFSQNPTPELDQSLEKKYLQTKTVVLVERGVQTDPAMEINLLNSLIHSFEMLTISRQLLKDDGQQIKVVGNLGIYVFDDSHNALRFARQFRDRLHKAGLECRVGLDRGPVLIFNLRGGGWDIAGMPVNISSKMAQDVGEPGKIYLTPRVQEQAPRLRGATKVALETSHVTIDAFWI